MERTRGSLTRKAFHLQRLLCLELQDITSLKADPKTANELTWIRIPSAQSSKPLHSGLGPSTFHTCLHIFLAVKGLDRQPLHGLQDRPYSTPGTTEIPTQGNNADRYRPVHAFSDTYAVCIRIILLAMDVLVSEHCDRTCLPCIILVVSYKAVCIVNLAISTCCTGDPLGSAHCLDQLTNGSPCSNYSMPRRCEACTVVPDATGPLGSLTQCRDEESLFRIDNCTESSDFALHPPEPTARHN